MAGKDPRDDRTCRWDFLIVPVFRHQSGMPYARTFVQTLNYGTAIIKTEPVASNRTPNITLVDLRVQKAFRLSRIQVMGLFDIYNLFNSNAEQMLTTSSGGMAAADGDHRASRRAHRCSIRMVMSWVASRFTMPVADEELSK